MSIFDFLAGDPDPNPAPMPNAAAGPRGVAAQIPGLSIQGTPSYGAFGIGPLSHGQKLALAAAGLRDALASVQGRPSDQFAAQRRQIMEQGLMQQQIAARQAYARALQAGDARALLAARAQLIASGAVPANYAFPQMQRGYVLSADGTQAQAVQGGPADPRVIAERAAARKGQLPPAVSPGAAPQGQVIYAYDENGEPQ